MLRRPQTKKTASAKDRIFKFRLPEDVATRIQKKAEDETRPMNRIVVNELAQFPELEKKAAMTDNLGHLENMLLRYGTRITWQELSEKLLRAANEVVKSQGAAHEVAVDKLRGLLNAMEKHKAGDSKK